MENEREGSEGGLGDNGEGVDNQLNLGKKIETEEKRKRGRPKGSKNTNKKDKTSEDRDANSKNKVDVRKERKITDWAGSNLNRGQYALGTERDSEEGEMDIGFRIGRQLARTPIKGRESDTRNEGIEMEDDGIDTVEEKEERKRIEGREGAESRGVEGREEELEGLKERNVTDTADESDRRAGEENAELPKELSWINEKRWQEWIKCWEKKEEKWQMRMVEMEDLMRRESRVEISRIGHF